MNHPGSSPVLNGTGSGFSPDFLIAVLIFNYLPGNSEIQEEKATI